MGSSIRRITVLGLLAFVFACAGESSKTQPRELAEAEAIERAERVAQALAGELMQRLQLELKSGGPTGAVTVCSEVAQELAAAHSVDGVTVRRVSLKLRNPEDRPDAFERNALLELQRLDEEGRMPARMTEIVAGDDGRQLRYLRPIRIMSTCLECHGPKDSLDPEVAGLISELYPDDEATGYASGDLRGAMSVTVPLD